jgi:hypothetical protein
MTRPRRIPPQHPTRGTTATTDQTYDDDRAFVRHMADMADDTLARLARLDGELDILSRQLEMLAPGAEDDDELCVMAGAIARLRHYVPEVVRDIAAKLHAEVGKP